MIENLLEKYKKELIGQHLENSTGIKYYEVFSYRETDIILEIYLNGNFKIVFTRTFILKDDQKIRKIKEILEIFEDFVKDLKGEKTMNKMSIEILNIEKSNGKINIQISIDESILDHFKNLLGIKEEEKINHLRFQVRDFCDLREKIEKYIEENYGNDYQVYFIENDDTSDRIEIFVEDWEEIKYILYLDNFHSRIEIEYMTILDNEDDLRVFRNIYDNLVKIKKEIDKLVRNLR